MHKGWILDKNKNKVNIGIPINLIIEKIFNIITCVYKITDKNYKINIINNGHYDESGKFIENKEIKNKVHIRINDEINEGILEYIFNEEKDYKINILEYERITNMSSMFFKCSSLILMSCI